MSLVGIVVATYPEVRTLIKGPIGKGERVCLSEEILVTLSGMGAEQAEKAARGLLGVGVTALVSWGMAGGLVPGLGAGSLILPQTVVAADQRVYSVDAAWQACLARRLGGQVRAYTGPMAESATVLTNTAQKKALFRRTGAIAVDMESATLAKVARNAALPLLVIRAVSDPLGLSIPPAALIANDIFGRLRVWRLFGELARHPLDLVALIRLGRGFRMARNTLAAVVRHTGIKLLMPE